MFNRLWYMSGGHYSTQLEYRHFWQTERPTDSWTQNNGFSWCHLLAVGNQVSAVGSSNRTLQCQVQHNRNPLLCLVLIYQRWPNKLSSFESNDRPYITVFPLVPCLMARWTRLSKCKLSKLIVIQWTGSFFLWEYNNSLILQASSSNKRN